MKQTRLWLALTACLTIAVISGCGGSGVVVDYAPVSRCNSIDLDPGECPR